MLVQIFIAAGISILYLIEAYCSHQLWAIYLCAPLLTIKVILCLLLIIPRSLRHPAPTRDSAQVHSNISMGLEVKRPPFTDSLDTFPFNSHTESGHVTGTDLISAVTGFTPSVIRARFLQISFNYAEGTIFFLTPKISIWGFVLFLFRDKE